MKSILTACMAVFMLTLIACASNNTQAPDSSDSQTESQNSPASSADNLTETASGKITVWSSLTQVELDSYKSLYNAVNPNVEVEMVAFPGDQYMSKLLSALRSDTGPDVVLCEINALGQLKDSDFLEDLSAEPYNAEELTAKQVPYVVELSRDSGGKLKGLTYQSCPGGFWYNRKLADQFMGTSDPEAVGELLSTWDKVVETGKSVYEKSGGAMHLLDSYNSATQVVLEMRTGPFVDANNKLYDTALFKEAFSLAKRLRENNVDAKLTAWTAAWNAGFYSEPSFIVLGMPSWGLHYCIKANTPEDAADTENSWGFCKAPGGYQAGGTWVSICSAGKNKPAAWDYVRTTTVDTRYLRSYVDKTGDMVGYIPAIEEIIASDFRDPFTGDQPIYEYMYNAAMDITPKPMTAYDDPIRVLFNDKTELLLDGQLDEEGALNSFLSDLQTNFTEITIE